MRRSRPPTLTYEVGRHVFVSGGSGRVVLAHGDGRYDVEMAWGEVVTAWAHDMAPRT
ncbi:hypothetical protein ABRQ22_14795 [Cellulosimicrobium sp. ES-005]|uniref:Uncharacterized protein n=1 Tax=Cellulosimicrobium sp. ES-005 TaxID=3163031 RepID=A0AAU8FW38_9MICO